MDVRPKDSYWPPELEPVAIIGAGDSGLSLTALALHFGHPVRIVDTKSERRQRARDRVADRLRSLERKGLLHDEVDKFLDGLTTTTSLKEATADAGFIIEALPETLKLKQDAFRKLAETTEETVMATATSLFSVAEVSEGNEHADRIVGTHFYDLGRPMPVAEIVPSSQTSQGTVDRAKAFVEGVGYEAVTLDGDAPGFAITRVLARLFHTVAEQSEDLEVAAVDAGFRELGFRQGPFELMDTIGLDRVAQVGERIWDDVPSSLKNLVAEEKLGRKAKEGWYGPSGRPEEVEATDPWPLLIPMLVEAAEVVDESVATASQVDRMLRLGTNMPGGPFQLVLEKGFEDVVEIAEANDIELGPLDDIDLPEIDQGIEVQRAGDVTLIRFTGSHKGNLLEGAALDAFASAAWEIDGPLILVGEGRYFLNPQQGRVPDASLDALRKTESVALLHGPLGDGAMSVARACRRRVARVDAAIGIDRPVPATRAILLELVDAVAHPRLVDKAIHQVLSQVTTVSQSEITEVLNA